MTPLPLTFLSRLGDYWNQLSPGARDNIIGGLIVAIVVATVGLMWKFGARLLSAVRRLKSESTSGSQVSSPEVKVQLEVIPPAQGGVPPVISPTSKMAESASQVSSPVKRQASSTPPVKVKEGEVSAAVELFVSYAHEDERLMTELVKHLSNLRRQGLIAAWHDRRISPGREWEGQISTHLETASVILLLISSDFMASDYCNDVEVTRALERHKAGDARVIPIILREVDWHGASFSHLQALPSDAKPIANWSNRDRAYVDVVSGIRRTLEELNQNSRDASLVRVSPQTEAQDIDDALEQIREKLKTVKLLKDEELIDEQIKQDIQRKILDRWIDKQ